MDKPVCWDPRVLQQCLMFGCCVGRARLLSSARFLELYNIGRQDFIANLKACIFSNRLSFLQQAE